MPRKRILYVEDDPFIAEALSLDLKQEGYDISVASSLAEGRRQLAADKVDMLILDINLGDGTSFELCRDAREEYPSLPILFLTARTDESSAVKGLSIGATDYLRKPFGRQELLLRIRRLLGNVGGRLRFGKLELDLDSSVASYAGKPVALTPSELVALRVLVEKSGQVVTRERLVEAVDGDGESFERTVNSHISRLRAKLKKAGASEIAIEPVYGQGYRLDRKKAA